MAQKQIRDLENNDRVEFGYEPRITIWSWSRNIIGYVDKVTDSHLYIGGERTIIPDGTQYKVQKTKKYKISRIRGLANILSL